MQRARATEIAANVPLNVFLAVLLFLCLAVSGCGTTCVSGVFNGNTSSMGVSNISCPLTKATGAVTVQIGVAQALSADSASFPPPVPSPGHVQHIFVTLRGIEAHPDIVADEDSPAWQELAPGLSAHPVQVDLLAPLAAAANGPAILPADEYHQLRLRLSPRNPSPDEPAPESSACGDAGWNCIVFADHSARPLEFPPSEFAAAPALSGQLGFAATQEFHIPLKHGAAGPFRVLPGETIHLSIEFDAASSAFFSSNAAVLLVPAFRVVPRPSSLAP